jgi:hypothetical protein
MHSKQLALLLKSLQAIKQSFGEITQNIEMQVDDDDDETTELLSFISCRVCICTGKLIP